MSLLPRPKFNKPNLSAFPRIKGWVSLIIPIVIILLVAASISVFFLLNSQKQKEENQKKEAIQSFLAEAKTFPSVSYHWKNRFSENTKQALVEKNKDKQFELLTNNFQILSLAYTASHDPKIRQTSEKLKDFLKTNYPDQYYSDKYNEEYFAIPCLDTGCGNLVYTKEAEAIITLTKQIKFQDPKTQEAILKQIEAANFTKEKAIQMQRYRTTFALVNSIYQSQKEKDPKLKELVQKLANLFKNNFPTDYDFLVKNGMYKPI